MEQNILINKLRSNFLFRLFLLKSLPAAFFSGIQLVSISEEMSIVTVKYSWFSKNPFRSIYFACLGMAAEMSSGILALVHTQHFKPTVSMLVLAIKADFNKKAIGIIRFECNDGAAIKEAVSSAIKTQSGVACNTISKGYDAVGDCVAEFQITWTFKQKTKN